MDLVWVRPMLKPVAPSEIEQLSPSAARVLEALGKRFQPAPAFPFRLSPSFWNARRGQAAALQLSQAAQPCAGRSDAAPRTSFAFSSESAGSGEGHLLRRPQQGTGLGSPSHPVSRNAPPSQWSTPNEGDCGQSATPFWKNDKRSNGSESATPAHDFSNFESLSVQVRVSPHAELNISPPMSSFSDSDNEHADSSLLYKGDLNSSPTMNDSDECRGRTQIDMTFTSLNEGTEDTPAAKTNVHEEECDIFESQDISQNVLSPLISLESPMEQGLMLRQHAQDNCLIMRKSESSPQLGRKLSAVKDFAQPASRSCCRKEDFEESDTVFKDCRFGDKINFLEFQTASRNKKSVLSPSDSNKQSSSKLKLTPSEHKARKFLGTPFKRALSSSCISNKDILKEAPEESSGETLEKEKENHKPSFSSKSFHDEDSSFIVEELASSSMHMDQNIPAPISEIPVSKTPTDTRPSPLFPIFAQTKRKVSDGDEKLAIGAPASCKKRLKFMVPYKKQVQIESPSTHKRIVELAVKLSRETVDKKQSQLLSEKSSFEIIHKLSLTLPQEISLTLQYKEGFCQLNRPQTCSTQVPENIFLRFGWSTDDVQYITVPLQKYSWSSLFLKTIILSKSRKICFEAQEMIQLLVDKFDFHTSEVSSQWLFLDPLIGCWLLNPDEPPHSFKEVLTFLKMSDDYHGTDMLLCKLSHCAEVLYERLTKSGLWKVFLHIEMRITPILACMELHGIQVNVKKLEEIGAFLKGRLETVQKAAHEAAGHPFQLTSPHQLSAILFDQLKLDTKHNINVKETDKRHSKSTSESMLVKFKNLHPLPGLVLEFRSLHKLKSTYVDALLGHVSGNCIYATWDQTSAATGRITANEPNLQTIPKHPVLPEVELRKAFVAQPGFSFLAADFQHIELRVFAHLSKDVALIRTLSQKTDVFKVLSQKWLQVQSTAEVSEEDRDKTKRIVYALMYGAGPSKLTEFLHIDYNHASSILQKFTKAFPSMQNFTKTTLEKCRKQGYLATETGRRRWFPQITSQNFQQRMHSERQAVNFLIQGTAADLCKCAMVHTQRHITATSDPKIPAPRLLLQIHDELLWEVHDSNLLKVTDVVQEAMEGATSVMQSLSSFSLPLPVAVKVGKTWGEMSEIKSVSLGPNQQL